MTTPGESPLWPAPGDPVPHRHRVGSCHDPGRLTLVPHLAAKISTVFTNGIVAVPPDPAFAVAVLTGAVFWVGLATLTRFPVSTTHAIVGAMIGAGLLLAPLSIRWVSMATRVAIPLLVSVAVSYALSALLSRVTRGAPRCACVDLEAPAPAG